ncbi:MAG: hypothetical protein H3C69_09190 [Candidatus Promineofilum sp.]|nr:hypothetical protein [Promineifilum sp.]
MNKTSLYKAGVILFALLSLFSIITSIPFLMDPETENAFQGVPQPIVLLSALVGMAGLIASYGAWKGQKWGLWLSIILSAINGLSALPGITEAPSNSLRLVATAGVVLSAFIIFALLWGQSRWQADRS